MERPISLAALLACFVVATGSLVGCSTNRFTESPPLTKEFAEVWKATRDVVQPYGIEREDEAKGEIESYWCGSGGLFRGEATRKKIFAVVEKKDNNTVVVKIMVRQETNTTTLKDYDESAIEWADDGFDTDMEEVLVNLITMKLGESRIEDDIRERLKSRPDLEELDRKIEEYRKKQRRREGEE